MNDDPAATSSRQQILHNRSAFDGIVADAGRQLDRGNLEAAAALVEIAAHFATWHHTGQFASTELEELCRAVSAKTSTLKESWTGEPGDSRRVLHVASMVSGLAGLQHLLRRWIALDSSRVHSVVVSQPASGPVPEELIQIVSATGGHVHQVSESKREGFLDRAAYIRQLAEQHDACFLHLQTEDVAPILAFSNRSNRPPVGLVNHADHSFWLGASVVDAVVNLRESGSRLCIDRRGVSPQRSLVLPTPLPMATESMSKQGARVKLGLDEDSLIILTVARAPKYEHRAGTESFAGTHVPLVSSHENVQLIAVGPGPDHDWDEASRATGGRIRAMGERSDALTFFRAADIYVDAYPMVSVTSLLEAGSHGLPLLTRCPFPDDVAVWCADAPGLDGQMMKCRTTEEYLSQLERLVASSAEREKIGQETASQIRNAHVGEGWLKTLTSIYEQMDQLAGSELTVGAVPSLDGVLDSLTWELLCSQRQNRDALYYRYRTHLPLTPRIAATGIRTALINALEIIGIKQAVKRIMSALSRA